MTLKKRREFLRVKGGPRWGTAGFVLEGRPRQGDGAGGARFGFTVTKTIGNAVVRNRIRRRLRALVRGIGAALAEPHFDYVLIARASALDRPFLDLAADLEQALDRVRASSPARGR